MLPRPGAEGRGTNSVVEFEPGVWGLMASRTSPGSSRRFAQATAVIYAILVVVGFVPALNTLFGLLPVHGHDIWLHAVLALPAAYFGFLAPYGASAAHPRV